MTVAATGEGVASGDDGAVDALRAGDESARTVATGAGAVTTAGVDVCGVDVEGETAVGAAAAPEGELATRAEPELEFAPDDGGAATFCGAAAAGAACAVEPTVVEGAAADVVAGEPCFDRQSTAPPMSSTTAAAAPNAAAEREREATIAVGATRWLGTVGADCAAVALFDTRPGTLGIFGAVITAEPVAGRRCE